MQCGLRMHNIIIHFISLHLLQGVGLVWESYKLDPYVQRLAEAVFNYQEKVFALLI